MKNVRLREQRWIAVVAYSGEEKITEKFFEKFPEYKEPLSKGETKLDIVGNALNLALNNTNKYEEINSKTVYGKNPM